MASQNNMSVADAAALAANGTPTPGASNSEAMRDAFFDRCREWGEKKGAGDVSKVGMILDTAKCAHEGLVKPAKIQAGSDAAVAYDRWRAGRAQRNGKALDESGDNGSRTNRVSEINKYIRAGALPLFRDVDMGGYGVLKRAVKIIQDRTDIKGETEDKLSKVATLQLSKPGQPLADDEIVDIITPAPKRDEAYVDAMGRVRQQLDSIATKFPEQAGRTHLNDHKTARACCQKIIDAEGGTAAEIRRREEEAAKAAAKATKASKPKKKGRK